MSIEIELKLQLDPNEAGKLSSHSIFSGGESKTQTLLNTYFDTPALTLHAQKIAVRFRKKGDQWLCTVKTAEPGSGGLARRNEWETAATPGVFDFSHVDATALREMLEANQTRLAPVFTTDFLRTTWLLRFNESRIELAIDQGWITSLKRRLPICEIELELLSGKITDLFTVSQCLQADFDLRPAIASKAERGYGLFLNDTPRPYLAKRPDINPDTAPLEAFRDYSLACLEHFQRNEIGAFEGARSIAQTRFLEQARLAVRRLRAGLKRFSAGLPEEFVAKHSKAWATAAHLLASAMAGQTLPPDTGKALSKSVLDYTADLYRLDD